MVSTTCGDWRAPPDGTLGWCCERDRNGRSILAAEVVSFGFNGDQLQAQIPRLRRYARALTGDRAFADDLTQDTLERAWIKRNLWRAETNLRAWLFSVMHGVFVNTVRRSPPTQALDAMRDGGFDAEQPGSSAETGAVLRDLQRALAALPPEQRAVILLVGLENLSYAESAVALDVPIGTVMSRLSRGRERLRQLLDEDAAAQPVLRRVK